jgi:sugar transferase (PEP-CTERM/EpsH1 system associated)
MRLLWVKAGGVVPLDTGGKIRSFHILEELARRHEITLFTFYPEQAEDAHPSIAHLFHRTVFVPLRLPKRGSFAEMAQYVRSLCAGEPSTIRKYYGPALRREFRRMLDGAVFDAMVCDFVYPAGLVDWNLDCVKVLFTHNVEAQVWERYYRVSSNPFWKLAGLFEYKLLARAEERYVRLADHVLTVSEPDRRFFSKHVDSSRITTVKTGVDVEYYRPEPGQEKSDTLVFTGSMDWMPNEDGIAWFADEVFPRIRSEVPGAELWVVGRKPSAKIQALEARGAGIRVTGRVDDIRPYLHQAAVYVVPLRSGSGTRLKIFEAMAAGKAVVSTVIGAEGLPVESGRNISLADDPSEFARCVVDLLRRPEERRRLGGAARDLVESGYSWPAVAAEFERLLLDLTERRTQGAASRAGRELGVRP